MAAWNGWVNPRQNHHISQQAFEYQWKKFNIHGFYLAKTCQKTGMIPLWSYYLYNCI